MTKNNKKIQKYKIPDISFVIHNIIGSLKINLISRKIHTNATNIEQ